MRDTTTADLTEVVLLAGGSSAVAPHVHRELSKRGMHVCAVSRSLPRLREVYANESTVPGLYAADLTNTDDVSKLAAQLEQDGYSVAAIVHLVGGWSGGSGIQGQTEAGHDELAAGFTSLRAVTRQFITELATSLIGRLIVVSSVMVSDPPPNSANYTAVKAALETWALACNSQLAKQNPAGAAAIIRTDSLAGREESFAELVGDIISAPAKRVGGRVCLHV